MRYCVFLAACGLAWMGVAAYALAQPADAGADLVFLGDSRPILLRFHVQAEDRPIQTLWDDYLKKWFDFLDTNGDGRLDASEIRHAPSDQIMLQLMRQGAQVPKPEGKQGPTPPDFPKDANGLTLTAFQRFYERHGAGAVQMSGTAAGQFYAALDDTLCKLLDRNRDGCISRLELQDAAQILMKLDSNDNEYVSAQEIIPASNPLFDQTASAKPGAAMQPVQVNNSFCVLNNENDSNFALTLLARYDRDKNGKLSRSECGLPEDLLDADKNGELDTAKLALWRRRLADFAFTVRLGKTATARIEVGPSTDKSLAKTARQVDGTLSVSLADAQFQLVCNKTIRAAEGSRPSSYLGSFRQADAKKRGFLELSEVQKDRQFASLAQIFPLVDRNGDAKMTEKELLAFVELQAGAPDCFASVWIAENGRNLFKLLDANSDGRLSPRELKSAWVCLKHLDVNGNDCLDPPELVRQFQLSIVHGSQVTGARVPAARQPGSEGNLAGASYPPGTPLWFKRMDRNGDGDISEREFLGTREEFNRSDSDGDGLISAAEAELYEAKVGGRR